MLVPDKSDKYGMYSKPGRVSVEMFQLLQLKDEILYNKKKVFKPKSELNEYESNNLLAKMKVLKPLALQEPKHTNTNLMSNTNYQNIKSSRLLEPLGKMVSREKLERIGKSNRENQTFGLYNPKYHLIFEKSQLYQNPAEKKKLENLQKSRSLAQIEKNKHSKSINISNIKQQNSLNQDYSQILFNNSTQDYSSVGDYIKLVDWKQRKVEGPVPLEKQLKRPEFKTNELNENRFLPFEIPDISSKKRVTVGFNMNKVPGRDHFEKFDFKQTCLDYTPIYNLKEQRSSSYSFIQLVPRKNVVKTSYCVNEQTFSIDNCDVNKSQIIKKVPQVSLEKLVSRQKAQVVQSYQLPEIIKQK